MWSRVSAFLANPVSFHMGSWSQQPLVGTHEDDRERQEATNENRSCLYRLMHTRLSMYTLWFTLRTSGQLPQVHGLNPQMLAPKRSHTLSAGEIKLNECTVEFCPGGLL